MIRLIVTGRRGVARHYKGLDTMTKNAKAQKIDAATLNAFARVGFAGEVAFAKEIELIKANAVKGKLPRAYSLAYCAAVVCAKARLSNTAANRELVVKERATRKDDWAAARNRLSRRVKAAGVQAGNASGRKRGAQIKAGKTAKVASANAPSMPKATAPAVPTLATTAEAMMWLQGEVARIETVARKNAKSFTTAQHNAIAALRASVKTEPNH
jgi:hypothetical protein